MNKMKALLLLLLCLTGFSGMLHAEQGCPPGMIPQGGQGATSCRPIPGYNQGGAAQPGGPSIAWVSRWGAIAMDTQETRVSAASRDRASKEEAVKAAMKGCLDQGAKQCEIISAYANGCVALASSETRFGVAARTNTAEAESAAKTQCQDAKCQIIYSNCSQPKIIR